MGPLEQEFEKLLAEFNRVIRDKSIPLDRDWLIDKVDTAAALKILILAANGDPMAPMALTVAYQIWEECGKDEKVFLDRLASIVDEKTGENVFTDEKTPPSVILKVVRRITVVDTPPSPNLN